MDREDITVKCRARGCINGWVHRSSWFMQLEPPVPLRPAECEACGGKGVVVRSVRPHYTPGTETVELPEDPS